MKSALVCIVALSVPFVSGKAYAAGTTVTVSVTASDASTACPNRILRYQWRSTDGKIANNNLPSTTWAIPQGKGVHFAYVLVSNGCGGYAQARVGINTDVIGGAPLAPALGLASPPIPNVLPSNTETSRTFVPVPNVQMVLQEKTSGIKVPTTGATVSDVRGELAIRDVPSFSRFDVHFSFDGGKAWIMSPYPNRFNLVTYEFRFAGRSVTDYYGFSVSSPPAISSPAPLSSYGGRVILADGSPCGVNNPFFGVASTASVFLANSSGTRLSSNFSASDTGVFILPSHVSASSFIINCEAAPQIKAPVPAPVTSYWPPSAQYYSPALPQIIAGVVKPVIKNMQAVLADGRKIGVQGVGAAAFLPPLKGAPSDSVKFDDGFLSAKGVDSRMSACKYYVAIGGARGCNLDGSFINPISFELWKRDVKIGKFKAPNENEDAAAFVNQVDLNLARDHHSIVHNKGTPNERVAAYVCNHLGPPFNPTQSEVDATMADVKAGKNLVACVAMDFGSYPNVNKGVPFTRFFIFGPSGELLPSVNLDTRTEKFVPGTCVVCHGGDHYSGAFRKDGKGNPDVGGHFLPYDIGNFAFSSQSGLTRAAQEEAIYRLNQNILSTSPTTAAKELIAGWYAKNHVANLNYTPKSWAALPAAAQDMYHDFIAKSCRTCHVAMVDELNFDHADNFSSEAYVYPRYYKSQVSLTLETCNVNNTEHKYPPMPNSLITWNRLWDRSNVKAVKAFSDYYWPGANICTTPPTP